MTLDDFTPDVDELRAELTVATDELIELADELAREVSTRGWRTPKLARDYQEKRLLVRSLRRAVAVEVAG